MIICYTCYSNGRDGCYVPTSGNIHVSWSWSFILLLLFLCFFVGINTYLTFCFNNNLPLLVTHLLTLVLTMVFDESPQLFMVFCSIFQFDTSPRKIYVTSMLLLLLLRSCCKEFVDGGHLLLSWNYLVVTVEPHLLQTID